MTLRRLCPLGSTARAKPLKRLVANRPTGARGPGEDAVLELRPQGVVTPPTGVGEDHGSVVPVNPERDGQPIGPPQSST